LKDKGPVFVGELAQAAGDAGLIGKKKPDGKWSNFTALYDAIGRVPDLPSPDDGWIVQTPKQDPGLKSFKGHARWLLRRAVSPF
jgi:hypothetical protein